MFYIGLNILDIGLNTLDIELNVFKIDSMEFRCHCRTLPWHLQLVVPLIQDFNMHIY